MANFSLTTNEVRRLLRALDGEHVPLSTLAFWAQNGLVVPSVEWTRRRGGDPRRYNLGDVAKARLICLIGMNAALVCRRDGRSIPRQTRLSRG